MHGLIFIWQHSLGEENKRLSYFDIQILSIYALYINESFTKIVESIQNTKWNNIKVHGHERLVLINID